MNIELSAEETAEKLVEYEKEYGEEFAKTVAAASVLAAVTLCESVEAEEEDEELSDGTKAIFNEVREVCGEKIVQNALEVTHIFLEKETVSIKEATEIYFKNKGLS